MAARDNDGWDWRDLLPARSGTLTFFVLCFLAAGPILIYQNVPNDRPIICGGVVMRPGTICTIGGTYESMLAREQHGHLGTVAVGAAMVVAGFVVVIVHFVRLRRRLLRPSR